MSCLLYVPGTELKKVEKALNLECRGIILDLEDAVEISQKSLARDYVTSFLSKKQNLNKMIYVRINSIATSFYEEDLKAIVPYQPDVIVLPKVESAKEVNFISTKISALEKQSNLEVGKIRLQIILESAKGIVDMKSILSANKRIINATIGMADLCRDLNISWESVFTRNTYSNLFIAERTKLSLISRYLNLDPPWDCVYMDFQNEESFGRDVWIGKNIGCQGKIAIHPKQMPIINSIYSTTEEEIKEAQEILRLYKEASNKGKGAIKINGMLIDEPIIERAKKILSISKSGGIE